MSKPTESLEPEPLLLDYTRGRRLKKGGQGTVYQYINRQTGALYAVKVLEYNIEEHNPQERPQSEINMLRETYVSQRLVHAHLLRVDAVFEYEDGFAIIMPYFQRGNLRQNPPRLTELRDAIRQILEALRHLHERGHIHRDIKPDNILVRNEKDQPLDLVVADYGLISLDDPVSFCGSPGYAAPEVVRNGAVPKSQRRPYTQNVDIYALGMLLLDILGVDPPKMWIHNRRQFNKYISAPIAEQLDASEPDQIDRCDALSTVDSMLRFDPSDRPSVDECLRLPWLSETITTPLAAQLPGTPSNPSVVIPLARLPIANNETWWHSNPRAVTPAQQVTQDRKAGRHYDLRKRRPAERHNPALVPKKNRVQKKHYESLPTPRLTPDNKRKAQEVHNSQPLETLKHRHFGSGLAKFASNTDQEISQESNSLLTWDKMELSD